MGRFPWQTIAGAATIALINQPLQATTMLPETGDQAPPLAQAADAIAQPAAMAEPIHPHLLAQNQPTSPNKPVQAPTPPVVFPQPQPMPTADKPMPMTGDPLQPYSPVPPMLPRAVAPPVGDIAVSDIDSVLANGVNLGTDVRIPRLVLQDAPATEVLRLLARTAGLNLVLGSDVTAEKTVSLDLENESVQDAFNYVLSIADLKGNRSGQTIFVSGELPKGLLATTSRTFRVNQAKAADMVAFLGKFKEQLFSTNVLFVDEERLNSVTVVGTPEDLKTAAALIQQGDLRQRQVAVNVKIFQLNLANNQDWSPTTSLGIAQYVMTFNPSTGQTNVANTGRQGFFNVAGFNALLRENNGKVLSDPTLVVQEGEKANFDLTTDVLVGIDQVVTQGTSGAPPLVTSTPKIEQVGLKLNVEVERIDDNGFITLKILPERSDVADTISVEQPGINGGLPTTNNLALKRKTTVDTGLIRVRDGQAIILAGLIDENTTKSAGKVPLLGDIPLIGSLFRGTNTTTSRTETVLIVTPQLLDDTGNAAWGYTYTPSPETNQMLQDRGLNLPPDRR